MNSASRGLRLVPNSVTFHFDGETPMTLPAPTRSWHGDHPARRRGSIRQALGAIAVAAVVGSLAACGSSEPSTPSSTASPSSALSTSAAPSTPGSGEVGPGDSGSPTTLTGKLDAGVESGCVVLVAPDGTVLANLIGVDTASAPMGSDVEVSGQFEPDMMTTCQQGKPFAVAEVIEK